MLTLASMIWAAWAYVHYSLPPIRYVPIPVTIEHGEEFKYNEIEDAIYVPEPWEDSCENQQQVVYMMALHFNNFKNAKQKFSQRKLIEIAKKWECVQ